MRCRSSAAALAAPIDDLDALAAMVTLHERLLKERPKMQARFEPLRAKFQVLERFDVPIPDEQAEVLDALDVEWERHMVRSSLPSAKPSSGRRCPALSDPGLCKRRPTPTPP